MTREEVVQGDQPRKDYMATVRRFYAIADAYQLVEPMPYAAEALDAITSKHEVTILSAHGREDTSARKVHWLARKLPAHAHRFQSCRKGEKHLWAAHVFIDDQAPNIDEYSKHHPAAVTVLVEQPWNNNADVIGSIRWPGITTGNIGWPSMARWLLELGG